MRARLPSLSTCNVTSRQAEKEGFRYKFELSTCNSYLCIHRICLENIAIDDRCNILSCCLLLPISHQPSVYPLLQREVGVKRQYTPSPLHECIDSVGDAEGVPKWHSLDFFFYGEDSLSSPRRSPRPARSAARFSVLSFTPHPRRTRGTRGRPGAGNGCR